MSMWKGTDTVGKYVFAAELTKFAVFYGNHHHISFLILKLCLLLFFGKPTGAFLNFFKGVIQLANPCPSYPFELPCVFC